MSSEADARAMRAVVAQDDVAPGGEGKPSFSRSRRLAVLAICCMSILIVGLDITIVNVALPAIGRGLHAPVSGLQWTVDAYTVVLAGLLMLSASMGDRFGRRRVLQMGMCLFTLGSLLCSLAPSLGSLIAFRMIQGVGASMLNPVALSIIRNTFDDPRERAHAIGLWGAVMGISLALGPIVGGVLVDSIGWRSIFWINIPLGLAAVGLMAAFVPESKASRPRRLDPVGQALVILSLISVTYAIIEGPAHGWTSAEIVSLFGVSLLAVVALVRYEHRRSEPLLELRFFASAPFSGATIIALVAFMAMGGLLFINTLYLQDVRGMSPFDAGLYTLPIAAMTVICAPVSGRFVGRRGARLSLLLGGGGLALGSLILTGATFTTPTVVLLGAYVIFGIGYGMVNPPITDTAVAGMPAGQAGVAAAVASSSRQVGQVLGVAIVGSISAAGSVGVAASGHAHLGREGWWLIVGCGVLVMVVGLLSTTKRALATAEAVASEVVEQPA